MVLFSGILLLYVGLWSRRSPSRATPVLMPRAHQRPLDEVLEAQVGYLDDLVEGDPDLLLPGLPHPSFGVLEDGVPGVLPDGGDQLEAELRLVGLVRPPEGLL